MKPHDHFNKIGVQNQQRAFPHLPSVLYLQPPAETLHDLYNRYADTAEYGWIAFVWEKKTFAYWDHKKKLWLPIYPDVPFERIEPENMEYGDTLVWNKETEQFETVNISIWNKNEY